MPQKRNPISSELMLAASKAVRQQAGLMLDAMVQDLERATGPWHAEWIALPESFVLTAGALNQARFMLGGLIVDAERMRHNLGLTSGLIVAEAVMMGLAPHTGRQQAHDLVYAACRAVSEKGGSLVETLAQVPEVAAHLDRHALERLTDPVNYLGLAPQMVDRGLALSRSHSVASKARAARQQADRERAPLSDGREPMRRGEAALARDQLNRYRAQQAAGAARQAIARFPELAAYSEAKVATAMQDAKARLVARGLPPDRDGFFTACVAKAIELLQAKRQSE